MIHSPTCEHALRALIFMASQPANGPILVRDIADASEVPRQSLAKILHGLRNKGLVKSTKGPGGGYELLRPGNRISLMEVIEAIDGPVNLSSVCILGLDSCNDESSCALHEYWKRFREQYLSTLATMSLAEAAQELERKRTGGRKVV